jgi:hypothetical protein
MQEIGLAQLPTCEYSDDFTDNFRMGRFRDGAQGLSFLSTCFLKPMMGRHQRRGCPLVLAPFSCAYRATTCWTMTWSACSSGAHLLNKKQASMSLDISDIVVKSKPGDFPAGSPLPSCSMDDSNDKSYEIDFVIVSFRVCQSSIWSQLLLLARSCMCWLQVHVIFSNELHNFVYSDFDAIFKWVLFYSCGLQCSVRCRVQQVQ